ncbi:MAG: flagellar brake protein [Pseudobdellovibrionaceae bacterium]
MIDKKEPFEKIRSLIERRKLFEDLAQIRGEILCKGEDDSLFHFRPEKITSQKNTQGQEICHASGRVTPVDRLPESSTGVIGNFSIDQDRFFFMAPMEYDGQEGQFKVDFDIFKLQRRTNFRINVPASVPMYCNIVGVAEESVFHETKVADLSAGGIRLYFEGQGSHLAPGLNVKLSLHPPSGKSLDLTGVVRHVQSVVLNNSIIPQYGIEFQDLTGLQKNRLISMTLELQKRVILGIS